MGTEIEFKHIRKSYGDKVIMEDFNLQVEKGEFITIIGSSGCGKTTALKMVNGLIHPDGGDILIEGENIREKDQTQLRRNIGYAIQGSVLFPHMTVEENISYVPNLLNRRNRAKTKSAVEKWMKIVGLDEEMKERYPADSSREWGSREHWQHRRRYFLWMNRLGLWMKSPGDSYKKNCFGSIIRHRSRFCSSHTISGRH